jgi:membrane fusion protein (multidrug efflux system)
MRLRAFRSALAVATLACLAPPLLSDPPARAQPGPAGPPAVGVVKAEKKAITETSEFVGRIQAIDRVDITARVTAFVEQRLFVEGTEVKQGDLLYKLEQPPFEAAVQQQSAAVAQNNALLTNANITLGRAQSLLNGPAGQKSTVDDAKAQQLSQAAQLMSAEAQLRQAQINLDYTEIHAPVAGKIGQTRFTIGNVVGPSSGPLATIVSQDPMYVLFPVSVRTFLELRKKYADKGGASAVVLKLKLPDGSDYGPTGKVDYVDPTVATNTDTLQVRGKIANPAANAPQPGEPTNRVLTDGEFVTVLVEGVQPVELLAIPRAAVLEDQQGSYVYVVGDGNKAEQRRLQLGQSTPDTAIVAAGLNEGETVIVDGLQKVRVGQPVAPSPAAATPKAPAGAAPAAGK